MAMTDEEYAEAQEALWQRIEAQYEPLLEQLFLTAMMATADRYEASGNPVVADDLQREIADLLQQLWEQTVRESGEAVMAEFEGKQLWDLETKQEPFWRRITEAVIQSSGAQKIRSIVQTTQTQIRRIIGRGEAEGLKRPDIVSRIRTMAPELSKIRARIITRTEVHSTAQFASNAVAKFSRLPLQKRWLSTIDSRTRSFAENDVFDHVLMHETAVNVNDVYYVPKNDGTTEPLEFPGDPKGSPSNIINCRCTQRYRLR